jgi:hypothetical protein
MRIERLPQDNRRTQGAARRLWYRQHSPEHLSAVAELVDRALAARNPDAPSAAVVLGAGACTELPLERLARACERVVLVDLDAGGMQQAHGELPSHLRRRVAFVEADITGDVSAALSASLHAQPWSDLTALGQQAALDAAASCIERAPVPDPPRLAAFGAAPYGLVVSALVLTQLFSLPLLDVLDTLAIVAPRLSAPEADPRYRAAARAFRRRVVLAHLDLMASLLALSGAALLLTDEIGHLLPPTRGPHAHTPRETLPMLPADVLDLPADLSARFTVAAPFRRWRWLVTAPTPAQSGRAYDVIGAVLRPHARPHTPPSPSADPHPL